ncbi:MAG: putative Ig domain-containing protein [Thermomicrobia bacterium]|nr:putative Ig domain-containing protein [Thermomicrobia bacterium]MCA1722680.1 putative Ig domain-containing protein [Thermomicrobia bacterium]
MIRGAWNGQRGSETGAWGWLVTVALLVAMCALAPTPVGAVGTTYYVGTNTDTSGGNCASATNTTCTLRDAIGVATSGSDTITFTRAAFPALAPTTIIPGSPLDVTTGVTIDGTGHQVTVSGFASGRDVFALFPPSGQTVAITALTITGATSSGIANFAAGAVTVTGSTISGNGTDGIFNPNGTATVTSSTIMGNGGDGIYTGTGTVTVTRSTISGNASDGIFNNYGGTTTVTGSTISGNDYGLYNNGGTATVTNSTISGNRTNGLYNSGGTTTVTDTTISGNRNGIFNYVGTVTVMGSTISSNSTGIFNGIGTVTLTNSTISGNDYGINNGDRTTVTNSTISGNGTNGIYNSGGTTAVTNTILAGNAGSDVALVGGTITDGGHNLVGSSSGYTFSGTGDTSGPALLAPLGSYGGPTQTVALLPGSPAIDAGDDTACATTGPAGVNSKDQRGVIRPVGAHCDIGAFESQGFTLTKTSGDGQRTTATTAFTNPLVVAVAPSAAGAADNEPVNGGVVTFTAIPNAGASATLTGSPATITGGQASVTATANTTAGSYSVIASAAGAASVTFSLTNSAPTLTLSPTSLPAASGGVAYSQTLTATGGTAPYTFAVTTGTLPTGLTLTTAGMLSGTPTAGGTFAFTIQAQDANGFTGAQQYTIIVTAPAIILSPTTLPGGVKGVAYPTTTITAAGGTAPYDFTVTTGTLPTGLTLSPAGVLSGKPTATGSFTVTVTATDANGFTGMQQYTLTVTAAPLTGITLTPPSGAGNPPSVKVGQSEQFTATGTYADGSMQNLTNQVQWSSSNPQVVTVDANGKVTGESPGTVTITASLNGVTQTITVTVGGPTPIGITVQPVPVSRPGGTTTQPGTAPTPAPIPTRR